MGDVGSHALRALIEQSLRGVAEGPARIDDVVDKDTVAARHVADDVHHLALARTVTALVDDGQRCVVEPLGQRTGAHHTAHVGRHDHQVLIAIPRLNVRGHDGRGEQIVGRDVEETLDLARMQIDCKNAVGACLGNQVRNQLG